MQALRIVQLRAQLHLFAEQDLSSRARREQVHLVRLDLHRRGVHLLPDEATREVMKFNWEQAGMPATLVSRLGRRELRPHEILGVSPDRLHPDAEDVGAVRVVQLKPAAELRLPEPRKRLRLAAQFYFSCRLVGE